MGIKDKTAYCGIYCPDCIHLHNAYSGKARDLQKTLNEIEFGQYASIDSPFGLEFKHWDEFAQMLNALANTQCENPCRPGGGCSGKPCEIMECCQNKGFAGCWECSEMESCDKFNFLGPRCGDTPKKNLREIKVHGLDSFADKRHNFYVWQK